MKAKTLSRDRLPVIYHSASLASSDAQRLTLWLIVIALFFLSLASLTSSIPATSLPTIKSMPSTTYWPIVSKVFIFIGIVTSFIDLVTKSNEKWYGARAIAESVKTLSWLYMMRTGNFNKRDTDADDEFLKQLRLVLQERKYMSAYILNDTVSTGQITSFMKESRAMNLNKRKDRYEQYRLRQQGDWYKSQARKNKILSITFSLAIILLQVATLAFLFTGSEPVIGTLTTLTAGFIAWTQMKQYSSLRESYAVTAHELSFIVEGLNSIRSDSDLSIFVVNAEKAISREHTLWQARNTTN